MGEQNTTRSTITMTLKKYGMMPDNISINICVPSRCSRLINVNEETLRYTNIRFYKIKAVGGTRVVLRNKIP